MTSLETSLTCVAVGLCLREVADVTPSSGHWRKVLEAGQGGLRGDSWCLGGEEYHLKDILAIAPVMLVSGRIAIVNRVDSES
jgi:hypothetical protein